MKRIVRSPDTASHRYLHALLVICTCVVIGCGGSTADEETSDAPAGSTNQSKPTAQAQRQAKSSTQESMESVFERAQAAAEAYKKAHPDALTESRGATENDQLAEADTTATPESQRGAVPGGPVSLEEDVGLDVTLPAGSARRSANRSAGFAMGNYAVPGHSAAEMMAFFDKELGRLGFTPNENVPNFGSTMGSGTEAANRNYKGEKQDVMVTAIGDPEEGVMVGVFVSDKN